MKRGQKLTLRAELIFNHDTCSSCSGIPLYSTPNINLIPITSIPIYHNRHIDNTANLDTFIDEQSSREVRTKEEMEAVLSLDENLSATGIQVLKVHMSAMDIPWRLKNQIALINARVKSKAPGSQTPHSLSTF
jgi:ethanolamine utilization protein EutA (predicted chaperonin)